MAYANTGAIIRSDLHTVVQQAADTEKQLIGLKVLPAFSADAKSGAYPKIKIAKGNLLKYADSKRGQNGSYNEITRSYEDDNYTCIDRGLEERVDDSFAADMARFFDAESTAAKLVLRNIMLGHEVRASGTLYNTSNFNATNSGVVYSEANIATIDLPNDISGCLERLEQKAQIANTMVINRKLWNRMRRSTKLQTFVFGNLPSGQQRVVTPQDIQELFGLQVLIASGTIDTSKQGQATAVLSAIWSDSYIWIGNVQSGDFTNGGAGRTIVWTKVGSIFQTETYRDEKRSSDMVRVRQHTAEKVIDETAGELITTQL